MLLLRYASPQLKCHLMFAWQFPVRTCVVHKQTFYLLFQTHWLTGSWTLLKRRAACWRLNCAHRLLCQPLWPAVTQDGRGDKPGVTWIKLTSKSNLKYLTEWNQTPLFKDTDEKRKKIKLETGSEELLGGAWSQDLSSSQVEIPGPALHSGAPITWEKLALKAVFQKRYCNMW